MCLYACWHRANGAREETIGEVGYVAAIFHPKNVIMQESFQHIKRMNSRPVVFYYPNTE